MKLLRREIGGCEENVFLNGDSGFSTRVNSSANTADPLGIDLLEVVRQWNDFRPEVEKRLLDSKRMALTDRDTDQALAPIATPQKVICIGKNYADHASEMGGPAPTIPVVFNKFPSAVIGAKQNIVLPRISSQVDYEGELVVVIGKPGSHIDQARAMDFVFGFCCGHDVSARDWQKGKPGGQWLLGKTFDTFAPIGPFIVTSDELTDPGNLEIETRVNGKTVQQSKTSKLIFSVEFLISHISQFCTLLPGDLIFTGTPGGVGAARNPPVFLKPGDQVEVEVQNLGVLRNSVVASDD